MLSSKRTVKYVFTAEVHRLSIKKNIKFLTKIVWKRHTNKTQTQLQQHEHGFSTFNQKLQLEINLVWDQARQLYEDKNTEIVAVIEFQGKVKSGGYVKYNIAQVVNNNLKNKLQTIPLTQCPDPNAYVEITFDYLSAVSDTNNNLDVSMSMLNVSSRDLNMSRVDFNDDKLSLQINRINLTVNKLNDLTAKVRNKENLVNSNLPKMKMTIEMLEGEKQAIKKQLQMMETATKKQQEVHRQQKLSILKQVSQLQKQLQRKEKQMKSQQMSKPVVPSETSKESLKYKQLYESALQQIQQLKSMNMKSSLNMKANFDDVQEMARFDMSSDEQQRESEIKKNASLKGRQQQDSANQLKKKNEELQQSLATMSYKLASLFNASFQYGGAELLDYLQTAIGLTQKS